MFLPLADIAALISRLSTDLDYLGSAIQANRAYGSPAPDRTAEWSRLQARIAATPAEAANGSPRVLLKILVNLRDSTGETCGTSADVESTCLSGMRLVFNGPTVERLRTIGPFSMYDTSY